MNKILMKKISYVQTGWQKLKYWKKPIKIYNFKQDWTVSNEKIISVTLANNLHGTICYNRNVLPSTPT